MDRMGAGTGRGDGPLPASSGCEELYCGSTIEGSLQGGLVEEGGKLSLRESWEQSLIRPDP